MSNRFFNFIKKLNRLKKLSTSSSSSTSHEALNSEFFNATLSLPTLSRLMTRLSFFHDRLFSSLFTKSDENLSSGLLPPSHLDAPGIVSLITATRSLWAASFWLTRSKILFASTIIASCKNSCSSDNYMCVSSFGFLVLFTAHSLLVPVSFFPFLSFSCAVFCRGRKG